MSLFNMPSIHVFNAENAESTIQRKPGATNQLHRRPFLDKTININKSPDVQFKKQLLLASKGCSDLRSPRKSSSAKTPNLDIHDEDLFSYKNKDAFDEALEYIPYTAQLNREDVLKIGRNFCGKGFETPPLSPIKNEDIFIPSFTSCNVSFEMETPEVSFEFFEENDVEIPGLDFNF